jgi:hypothetical protein
VGFGFTSDHRYAGGGSPDLLQILGPVESDAEWVVWSNPWPGDRIWTWKLSRASGLLTVTDDTAKVAAEYACERGGGPPMLKF